MYAAQLHATSTAADDASGAQLRALPARCCVPCYRASGQGGYILPWKFKQLWQERLVRLYLIY